MIPPLYRAAGNHTSASINGVSTTRSYDAANQVIGWQYDAAGNLLYDGHQTLRYNLFGQLTRRSAHGQTTDYTATSDGVLLSATTNGATTRYTQDQATPLAQILSDGATNYVYGHERLAAQAGSTTTWYASDALGSVRQTLNASGAVLSTISYDPWGQVESGSLSTFGFTGERQDAGGLVYLRARWYDPASGMFPAARWRSNESSPFIPFSNHVYAYALANPVNWTDPSGRCIGWLWDSETCAFAGFDPRNWNYEDGAAYAAGVASNVVDPVASVYTLATSAEAREAAWQQLQNLRPSDIPGIVIDGILDPFRNLSQGFVCDDSYLLGKGIGGIGIEVVGTTKVVSALRRAFARRSVLLAERKDAGTVGIFRAKPVVDTTSPRRYSVSQGKYYFEAAINDKDIMQLSIKTKINGVYGDIYASKEFDNAINYFGRDRVKGVQGVWDAMADERGDILAEFNNSIAKGLDPYSAAFKTWTGRNALSAGFDDISEIMMLPEGQIGNYELVIVKFTRR